MVNILAISGSLRRTSSNTAVLKALAALSTQSKSNINISLFPAADLEAIPHFNPDKDIDEKAPAAVTKFRNALEADDGILIASPEYAGGIAGALKDPFDWIVSTGLIVYQKPFALINTSLRATEAYDDLKRIVSTMGGDVIERVCRDARERFTPSLVQIDSHCATAN